MKYRVNSSMRQERIGDNLNTFPAPHCFKRQYGCPQKIGCVPVAARRFSLNSAKDKGIQMNEGHFSM